MNDEKVIILRTYNNVWKIDRRIYAIDKFKLPFSIVVKDFVYVISSICFSLLLQKYVPIYAKLHVVIKFGLVPYLITKFLTKQKLDGKLPHKFFICYLQYKFSPKKYTRFKPIEEYKEDIKFNGTILYRKMQVVDKTERAMKGKKKRGGEKGDRISN